MKLGEGGAAELKSKKINIADVNTYNSYYLKTRHNVFITACKRINAVTEIKNGLDLATANGHFVYLANKQGLDMKGGDIDYKDEYNNIFIKEFKESKLFELNLNNLHEHNNNYDIITSFGLTHIFDNSAIVYLIKVISSIAKYCYLHVNDICIQNIKDSLSNTIEIIDIFVDNINAGPGANTWCYIFIKFKNKINIDNYKKFCRLSQSIIIN